MMQGWCKGGIWRCRGVLGGVRIVLGRYTAGVWNVAGSQV